MKQSADQQKIIHQHSGWLIPLGFALAILALSGLFLLWYLRPGPQGGALTGDAAPVALSVHGLKLAVPANYIATPAARAGGEWDMLALAALLPDLRGYSQSDAALFAGNAPDSPVIHLLLRGDPNSLDARARLRRVYMPSVANSQGSRGPFDLTQYTFRSDSGYGRDDLFTGESPSGLVLFLCERGETDLPSPNCLATAPAPTKNLSFSWRFKRAYLSDWRRIAAGVGRMMARFEEN